MSNTQSDNVKMVKLAGNFIGWGILIAMLALTFAGLFHPIVGVVVLLVLAPLAFAYEVVHNT